MSLKTKNSNLETIQISTTSQQMIQKKSIVKNSSIFIPYWALPQSKEDIDAYDRLMYFGIGVDENGAQKNEIGYKQLSEFQAVTKGYFGKKSLVIRMLDTENNTKILNNEKIQNTIILEINNLVNENGFTELALDLELSGLFNTDITNKVNLFVQKIYTLENRYYKHFSVIIYGDVFYRSRPFDIKSIGNNCDELMIMAYDFSKPYGEPGPNFPYEDKEKWGYDFKEMIRDYTLQIVPEKLSVIFGMYGYNWTLNQQGTPLKRAETVTVNQIKKILNSKLSFDKAQDKQILNKSQIPNSKEKKIEYVDSENQKHVMWYEDEESAQVKIDYLKEKGVGSIGYWAYGYF